MLKENFKKLKKKKEEIFLNTKKLEKMMKNLKKLKNNKCLSYKISKWFYK